MSQSVTRVLLVDDEPSLRRGVARLLGAAGCEVSSAANGREAMELIERTTFDVIVSDIRMPGMDGLSLLRAVRARDLDVPVVFLTGSPSLETAMQAVEHGAFRYLKKPIDGAELTSLVRQAAQIGRLARVRREALDQGVAGEVRANALGDRAALEARFDSALERMWMATQPILSWRTRSVFAYEALLRSDEPLLSSPEALLDAAERLGRSGELGRRIRRCVADQMIAVPPSVLVFVNVRPLDLLDEELAAPDGALTSFAHGIVLEVTERAALEQIHGLMPAVQRLRALGYRIALDDLGAGYAGLSSFALLEPEIVKVDMSLIRGIHQSPTKQKLFRSFASLCREINTEIIAEGVEVADELSCLNDLGGDLYQGYLFARPGRGLPNPVF
ncbi:MAG TPA: EAL domain-containing protein [Polyangia bacterium]|nr:EAL domain-containing protein [Polyangia bacterium]